ncbi:hypothetical protein MMC07_002681 [Pseudocyphellaria aurata]|nr:hypothetical protein [Pseudocyphellaria aurata]
MPKKKMAAHAKGPPVVKTEPGSQVTKGKQPRIKQEADSVAASPSAQSDEDIYEDAGDLDFGGSTQGIYLTRIPKYLWETWSKLDDDDEIRIGTIRVEGSSEDPKRMSLLLSSDAAQNRNVPKEYNMHVANRDSSNTFIFTEKDLPGYASRMKGTARKGVGNGGFPNDRISNRTAFRDRPRQSLQAGDKSKRWQPNFRKAIPKQTALVGQIRTEINCLPVENGEYHHIMEQRAKETMKPKRETRFLTEAEAGHGGNLLVPGTLGQSGNFDKFIRTTDVVRGKAQDSRAARMPQNELLDMIYDCFKRYNYWSLKSLKAELNQPEAYLKQTLEKVALLVRQGTHAMTWQLKPESKLAAYADAQLYDQEVKDEVAPDLGGFDGVSDNIPSDEDDENIEMEDVLPA